MKKQFSLFAVVVLALLSACGGKHEHHETATAQDSIWIGMDEFHLIMAESFHPYKDSANLEPAKKYAYEMDSIAGVWLASSRPEKVNNDEVKQKMEKLKADTKLFAEAVKTDADSTVAKSLTDLHDQFHALQEAWYGGGDEHKEHH